MYAAKKLPTPSTPSGFTRHEGVLRYFISTLLQTKRIRLNKCPTHYICIRPSTNPEVIPIGIQPDWFLQACVGREKEVSNLSAFFLHYLACWIALAATIAPGVEFGLSSTVQSRCGSISVHITCPFSALSNVVECVASCIYR